MTPPLLNHCNNDNSNSNYKNESDEATQLLSLFLSKEEEEEDPLDHSSTSTRKANMSSSFLPQAVGLKEETSDDFHHHDNDHEDDDDDDDDDDREGRDQFDQFAEDDSTTPPQSPVTLTPPEGAMYTVPLKNAAPLLPPTCTSARKQFVPHYNVTWILQSISRRIMRQPSQYDPHEAATWIGFWAAFLVTCSNFVLMPMRDAIALAVGVEHIPSLTLACTVLAVFSSVPIGWLFEAPDPQRRPLWKRIGLTRGETQGTSLALFYRFFAMSLWSYAIGFKGIEFLLHMNSDNDDESNHSTWGVFLVLKIALKHLGKAMYIAFFLAVHLMKQHSVSLLWGVTTEAMEYEETSQKRHHLMLRQQQQQQLKEKHPLRRNSDTDTSTTTPTSKTRLQRLAFVGFGGTVGGILGSMIASSLAQVFRLSGLLVVSALMLEAAAQLAIELGRIMHQHWTEQQSWSPSQSQENLAGSSSMSVSSSSTPQSNPNNNNNNDNHHYDNQEDLDPSMKRSSSMGSMKRISSGNSLSRVKSMSELKNKFDLAAAGAGSQKQRDQRHDELEKQFAQQSAAAAQEDSFSQRLFRGIRTILRSRLLMAIFTYNALYASTTVLLSFQRAELVANRSRDTTAEADTAFLANINMASSVAVFVMQASGLGAFIAHMCGSRGTLSFLPMIRLLGVLTLAYWHHTSNGEPPNLLLFLVLDECCRIVNMAVAKPVRESLWRGLSNEARYEAKPIVDTLANRWGGGSAAFLASSIHKLLDLFGIPAANNGEARVVMGFPPVLFLCMIVSFWWAGVSADLGHIRHRIDLELKKMQ